MRESKKSQLAGIAGAIGVALLAFLLIFSLNSLQWPLASKISEVITDLPSPDTIPDGVLLVHVVSNLTIFPTSAVPSIFTPAPGYSSINEANGFAGVIVYIYEDSNTQPSVQNITNSLGRIQENLSPNTYSVKLVDWRANNLTVKVQIKSNQISYLNVTVNATSYMIESANIDDPDFSGWAVSWGQVYARVDANQTITAQDPQIYLDTGFSPFTPLTSIQQTGVTPIKISSADQSNGSQWVQLEVSAPMNISNIKSMSILTLHSQYNLTSNPL